jgi:radical SAM superfamily enzyme YgiQ (UPF0313 family)
MKELVRHHIAGQLKVAPEQVQNRILKLMRKPTCATLFLILNRSFDRLSGEIGKRQFLTYYFIAALPGYGLQDMKDLGGFVANHPWIGEEIYVERDACRRALQKVTLTDNPLKKGRK